VAQTATFSISTAHEQLPFITVPFFPNTLYAYNCFLLGRENGHGTISWLHVSAVVHNSATMWSIHKIIDCTMYSLGVDCIQNTASSVVVSLPVATETSLPFCCLAMAPSTHSTILAFSHYVTIHWNSWQWKIFLIVSPFPKIYSLNKSRHKYTVSSLVFTWLSKNRNSS
jgi:hypothetical protein